MSPGAQITVASPLRVGKGKWVGFAREETLQAVWDGWVPVDIKADAFAERNRAASKAAGTAVLTWGDLKGKVISGIGNRKTGEVRVITRNATEDEVEKFGHNRMPVIIEARF
jgi:hypothetical protein